MEKPQAEYEILNVPFHQDGALQPARYTYEEAMEMNGLSPNPVVVVIDLSEHKQCPHCQNNVELDFWQVGDITGPGCSRCGATAKTIQDWDNGLITEPTQDY